VAFIAQEASCAAGKTAKAHGLAREELKVVRELAALGVAVLGGLLLLLLDVHLGCVHARAPVPTHEAASGGETEAHRLARGEVLSIVGGLRKRGAGKEGEGGEGGGGEFDHIYLFIYFSGG